MDTYSIPSDKSSMVPLEINNDCDFIALDLERLLYTLYDLLDTLYLFYRSLGAEAEFSIQVSVSRSILNHIANLVNIS